MLKKITLFIVGIFISFFILFLLNFSRNEKIDENNYSKIDKISGDQYILCIYIKDNLFLCN